MALPSDSSNVRPMAMISPTAFMRVDSVSSVPWNFSNAKRGTFTTQSSMDGSKHAGVAFVMSFTISSSV